MLFTLSSFFSWLPNPVLTPPPFPTPFHAPGIHLGLKLIGVGRRDWGNTPSLKRVWGPKGKEIDWLVSVSTGALTATRAISAGERCICACIIPSSLGIWYMSSRARFGALPTGGGLWPSGITEKNCLLWWPLRNRSCLVVSRLWPCMNAWAKQHNMSQDFYAHENTYMCIQVVCVCVCVLPAMRKRNV